MSTEELLSQLFRSIGDQEAFMFSGRINFLDGESRRLIGSLGFKDGVMINIKIGSVTGEKGLFELAKAFHEINNIDLVSEPEIMEYEEVNLSGNNQVDLGKLMTFVSEYKRMNSLKPPDSHKLSVSPEIFTSLKPLESEEFDTLCAIADHSVVKDIYRYSKCMEYEVTKSLISLRKKGFIKVIK